MNVDQNNGHQDGNGQNGGVGGAAAIAAAVAAARAVGGHAAGRGVEADQGWEAAYGHAYDSIRLCIYICLNDDETACGYADDALVWADMLDLGVL